MNGKHLIRVASLGIYLSARIFFFYLVLQVPQFAFLKLTIISEHKKPCIAGDKFTALKLTFLFIKE